MMIIKATLADAAPILELQKLAYQSEALIYNDFSIPPLLQTLNGLSQEFTTKTVLKAVLDGRLVGSVRAWDHDDRCYIERLIVHPDFQGQGIGAKLMGAVETVFSHAKCFELFTGQKSVRNIRLYSRLGYQVFKYQHITDNLVFTYMAKVNECSNSPETPCLSGATP